MKIVALLQDIITHIIIRLELYKLINHLENKQTYNSFKVL